MSLAMHKFWLKTAALAALLACAPAQAKQLSVWFDTAIAVRDDGTLVGWGKDGAGLLGGSAKASTYPLNLARANPLGPFQAVAMHGFQSPSHALGLRRDGTVWAWGRNNAGQLGRGTVTEGTDPTPAQVPGIADMVAVATGEGYGMALRRDGTVWGWGDGNTSPRLLPFPGKIKAIEGASHDVFALGEDGKVWAWPWGGWNSPPHALSQLTDIAEISVGIHHLVALDRSGVVWEWEWQEGTYGEGNGLLRRVEGLPPIASVTVAYSNLQGGYAIAREGGTVWHWNTGVPNVDSAPVQVPGLRDVAELATGRQLLALTRSGALYRWERRYDEIPDESFLRPGFTTPAQLPGPGNEGLLNLRDPGPARPSDGERCRADARLVPQQGLTLEVPCVALEGAQYRATLRLAPELTGGTFLRLLKVQ